MPRDEDMVVQLRPQGGVRDLAHAGRMALDHIRASGPPTEPSAVVVAAFHAVYVAEADAERRAILDAARGDAARCDRLLLGALPALARHLGQGWVDGTTSFVDVSIACAHIHDALRRLGDVAEPDPGAACVVVATPEAEDHTLPLALLRYRLRRAGLHVRSLPDAQARGVARAIDDTGAAMVMLSASTDRGLLRAADILRALRRAGRRVPVALGGAAVLRSLDIARAAGADCITDDPMAALRACGVAANDAAPVGTGSDGGGR